MEPGRRTTALRIALLAAFAGLLGGGLAARAEILCPDGLRYIRQAQSLERGALGDGIRNAVDHPAYPLAIVAAHRCLGGESPEAWMRAAQAASVVSGVLLVVPLYLVACELFGASSAWLACLLSLWAPVTAHVLADTFSEGTFLVFWTWGLWAALRFLREGRARWLPGVLALAALAYLTRPEGLLLPLALLATLLVAPWWRATALPWPRWRNAVAVLLVGPACLVGPYVALRGGLGTKPSIARLLGTASHAAPLAVERQRPLEPGQTRYRTYVLAWKALGDSMREAVGLPLAAFALVGLGGVRPGRVRARAWAFLAIVVIASTLGLIRLHTTAGYCSPRHTLIISLLFLAAAASGLLATLDAVAGCLPWRAWAGPRRDFAVPVARCVVVGGLMLVSAPSTLAPVNSGMGVYRSASAWLGTRLDPDARIVDATGWTLFFTGRSGYTFADLHAAPEDARARWLVAREAHLHGPWDYCLRLRCLCGGRPPVATFRGTSPRHPTKLFVFDLAEPPPRLAAGPGPTVR